MKESEEQFRRVVEAVGTAIFMFKGNQNCYVNSVCEQVTGYSRQELLSMNFWDILHPDFQDLVRSRGLRRQNNKKVPSKYEVKIIRKDGEERWLDFTAVTIDFEDELTVLGVAHDITERKLLREQMCSALEEKEILLREIHHRVKNNFQLITTLFDLQSEYIADKEVLESCNRCKGRVQSIACVHELLYQPRESATVNSHTYIRALVETLFQSYQSDAVGLEFRLKVDDVSLAANRAIHCGLIINELVSNALKYAFPSGRGGEICVELRNGDDNGLTLIISDNGVGLPKGLDFRDTESLGLQLVCLLAEQLDGTVELDRTGGTSFQVTFPDRSF